MRSIRIIAALILLIVTASSGAADEPRRILVFGDSNSWGWIPVEKAIPTERYPADTRWPGVMRNELGEGYEVVVDALSGRTTDVDDPTFPSLTGAGLNGSKALPAVIAAHLPLDLVVIMLGTNDTKAHFERSAFRIALGAGELISIAQDSGAMFGGGWYAYPAPRVLLVAPPPIGEQRVFGELFAGGIERSRAMASAYALIAEAAGAAFFDAGSVIETDGVDGIHFSAEAQRTLGRAMTEQVRALLE